MTVAAYLQDHSTNPQSLAILPRTHRLRSREPQAESMRAANAKTSAKQTAGDEQVLHPALGDVVVFDTRLIHRAQVIHLPSISP